MQAVAGTDGIDPGQWQITEIGTGPVEYEFNVALAVTPDGDPALTYYDNNTGTLNYASRSGGTWSIEVIDDDGDPGRYSSLAFDADGVPHVSYVDLISSNEATVRYATLDGGSWVTTDVATLDQVATGFTGARRITSIQIDIDGSPHVVFGDAASVYYGELGDGGWSVDEIVAAGDAPLGQLVSFAIDAAGVSHITTFEATSLSPLDGTVVYLTDAS